MIIHTAKTSDDSQDSMNELEMLYHAAPAGLALVDKNLCFTRVNDQFAHISGLSREDHIGRTVSQILPSIAEQFERIHRQVFQSGQTTSNIEISGETPAQPGRKRTWNGTWYPVTNHDRVVVAVGVILQEITTQTEASEALNESEQRFRQMADAAPVLIWMSDSQKKGIYFNERWLAFTGRSLEQELGDGWLDTIHPDDCKHATTECQQAFDAHQPFRMEFRMRRADGEYRWVLDHGIPRFAADGTLAGYIGSIIDVHERKQIEEALRASEERYRAVVENQAEMLCRFRPSGEILFVNRAYAEAQGASKEALMGANFWTLIPAQDRPGVRAALDQLTPENPEKIVENRLETRNGERWILWTNRALDFDVEGRVLEAQSSGIDITERKRTEADLEFQKYAIDQSSIVAITDIQGTISYVNTKFCEISGYSREELIGQNHRIISSDFHSKAFFRDMYRRIANGEVWRGEIRNRRKDGSLYWVDTTIVPAIGPDGKPERYVALRNDISERKHAESSLHDLNRELEAKVKERTLQLEQQSDRLRLLADQLVATEQAERKRIAALIHDHLQQILVAGKFQLNRVTEGLAQKRYDDIQSQLLKSEEFLNEAIRAAKSLTAELRPPVLYEGGLVAALHWLVDKYLDDHHLKIRLEAEDVHGLEDTQKIMLFELIRELLFNVIKHARTDEVWIRMHTLTTGELYLCVEDKGIGFDVNTKSYGGKQGFGLFHITERLKLLNAKLTITSAPRKGTKVEIILPFKQETPLKKDALQHLKQTAPLKRVDDKTITVLMVDDHRIVRQGIVNLIEEEHDLKVIAQAENGHEAVEKARMFLPDVIVMDLNMPILNGVEATRIIKAEFPNIRIIGLSVQDELQTAHAIKAAGAEILLNKVEDPTQLIAVIRNNGSGTKDHL